MLNTESAPENHTQEIRKLKPSHIIIVDAVEFDAKAGSIITISKNQIDTFNFSTHSMPISFIINYIEETIGIQPKEMNIINTISDEVKSSANDLTDIIAKLV